MSTVLSGAPLQERLYPSGAAREGHGGRIGWPGREPIAHRPDLVDRRVHDRVDALEVRGDDVADVLADQGKRGWLRTERAVGI